MSLDLAATVTTAPIAKMNLEPNALEGSSYVEPEDSSTGLAADRRFRPFRRVPIGV